MHSELRNETAGLMMTPSFWLSLGVDGEGSTGGGGRGVESKPSAREAVAGSAKGRAGSMSGYGEQEGKGVGFSHCCPLSRESSVWKTEEAQHVFVE